MLFQMARMLALLSLVVAVGCGQNPSVKGGGTGGSSGGGSGPQESATAPAVVPGDETGKQEDGKQDDGSQGEKAGNQEGTTGPDAPSSGSTIVVPANPPVNGKDGADGKDGAGDKAGNTRSDSGSKDGKDGQDNKDTKDTKDGADGKDGKDGKDGTGQNSESGSTGPADPSKPGSETGSSSGSDSGSENDDGSNGTDSNKDSDKQPTPESTPIVIIQEGKPGDPGRDGKDGRDGRDGKDAFAGCNSTAVPVEMMRLAERENHEAPIMSTKKRKIERLTLGDKAVENKMVFFKTPIELPPREVIGAHDVIFEIKLKKLANDYYPWTEFLALLDERIWSGMNFSASNFLANNNPNYPIQANAEFSHIICEEVMQDKLACDTLIDNPKDKKAHNKLKKIIKAKKGNYDLTVTIRLSQILKGSKYPSAADYMYRNAVPGQPVGLEIPMVIGDDSGVSSASATVLWDKPECVGQSGGNE